MIKKTLYIAVFIVMSMCLTTFATSQTEKVAPNTSIDLYKDPQQISDQEFFGVWNGSSWVRQIIKQMSPIGGLEVTRNKPILKYSEYPLLNEVETIVKNIYTNGGGVDAYNATNAYDEAKAKLFEYYRDDRLIPRYEYIGTGTDTNLSSASKVVQANLYSDLGFGTEFTVDSNWAWRKISIPKSTVLSIAGLNKNGTDTLIYSKENTASEFKPYLEVVTTSAAYKIYPSGDTYTRAGVNRNKNYGSEGYLKVREDGVPFSDFTKRAYLYFDFDAAGVQGTFVSATLSIYAKTEKAVSETRLTVLGGNPNFDETTLTWNNDIIRFYNYSDPMFGRSNIFDWTPPVNSNSESINGNSRLGGMLALAADYQKTKKEECVDLMIRYIMSYYHYRQPFAPRLCDTAWRTDNLIKSFFTIWDSPTLNSEVFVAILKLLSYTSEFNTTQTPANNNRGTVLLDSGMLLGAYFPELAIDGTNITYWKKVNSDAITLYGSLIQPDGDGYPEATTGIYPAMALNNIVKISKLAKQATGADDPYWLTKSQELASYLMNVSFPNTLVAPYGDNSTGNNVTAIKQVADLTGNQNLLYFATAGKFGKQTSLNSFKSNNNKLWMMRTSLVNPDSLALFGNAENKWGHSHADDLSIDVYGYGKLLLREPGNREYDSGTEAATLPLKTYLHNTVTIAPPTSTVITETVNQAGQKDSSINAWVTNDIVDYVDASTLAYNGVTVAGTTVNRTNTRKILFLKDLGFWIVSDYVKDGNNGTAPVDLYQTWSPNLESFFTVDGQTKAMTTNYVNSPNIQVVPADPDQLSWAKTYTLIERTPSEAFAYKKDNVASDTTFDTVLCPNRTSEVNPYKVTLDRLPITDLGQETAIQSTTATAFEINTKANQKAFYYNAHDKANVHRKFGNYSTNADVAFVNTKNDVINTISFINGTNILMGDREILSSSIKLSDLTLNFTGQTANLASSSNVFEYADIRIYAPAALQIGELLVNGSVVKFFRDGEYLTFSGSRAPQGKKFKVGDYIQMGVYDNKPILWRVVDVDANGPLVVSNTGLTQKLYDTPGTNDTGSHTSYDTRKDKNASNYWGDSNIRYWLNSKDANDDKYTCGNLPSYKAEAGFLNAFDESELSVIKSVSQKTLVSTMDSGRKSGGDAPYSWDATDANSMAGTLSQGVNASNYDSAYYENFADKIFIPDIKQIDTMYNNKYWLGDDYYMTRDLSDAIGIGWVRTPVATGDGNRVRVTLQTGGVNVVRDTNMPATGKNWWVRPAFYVDETNIDTTFQYGDGSKSKPYSMEEIPVNIALGKTVTADSYLKNNDTDVTYAPNKVTDGDTANTRWATSTNVAHWVEIDLGSAQTFNNVVIYDYTESFVPRLTDFTIDYWNGTGWVNTYERYKLGVEDPTISISSTVSKRSIRFPEIAGSKIRININSATNNPTIWEIGAYKIKMKTAPTPEIKKVKIGDYIQMGTDNSSIATTKPAILWRVVDINENGVLAIADNSLATIKQYDALGSNTTGSHSRDANNRATKGSNYWSDSNLRDWLNSDAAKGGVSYSCGNSPTYSADAGFLKGFQQVEKDAILSVSQKDIISDLDAVNGINDGGAVSVVSIFEIPTSDALAKSKYDTAYYKNITDKIFLPDLKQIVDMYNKGNTDAIKTLPADYYMAKNSAGTIGIGWVRTPDAGYSGSSMKVTIVSSSQNQVRNTANTYDPWLVRPMCYIDPTKVNLESSGSSTAPFNIIGFTPIVPEPEPTKSLAIGEYVQFGTDNSSTAATKPAILWRVVEVDPTNGPLLIADKILVGLKEYDIGGAVVTGSHSLNANRQLTTSAGGSNYWMDSNIKDWLNSTADAGGVAYTCGNAPSYSTAAGFLKGFSQTELDAIKSVNHKNIIIDTDSANKTEGSNNFKWRSQLVSEFAGALAADGYDTAYSVTSNEKIFLPDIKNVALMYSNRTVLGDNYFNAKDSTGAYKYAWIRTPRVSGGGVSTPTGVLLTSSTVGSVGGGFANAGVFGVRPMLYLDNTKVNFITNGGTSSNPFVLK